jgi:nucleoid-associated protein YgaU
MRYRSSKILKTSTGVQYQSSTIYPKIKANDNDLYVISEAGDRLDILANKYYKDPSMWWVIATANNLNDANFFVQVGTQLRIPADASDILNNLYKINK